MSCLVKARGRQGIAIFLLALMPALFVPYADSAPNENKLPYGSSCYEHYGARGNTRSISYAIGAVRKYFKARGFYVKLVEHDMRFLTVEVLDHEKLVDTVVVDIRTGKMRSVQ